MQTQREMILKHLQDFGYITPLLALEVYGCYRLSAQIFNLREEGHDIKTEYITRKNRFGQPVTFAKYVYKNSTED